MNLPKKIYIFTDLIIKLIIKQLISTTDIARRLKLEEKHHELSNQTYSITTLSTIHDRASSMVSHLSLMLGVCLFLMQSELFHNNHWIERVIIVTDAVIYIFLVLLTVRCLRSIGLDKDYNQIDEYWTHFNEELIFKYSIMEIVNSVTILATIILVIALLLGINIL